MAGIEHHPVYSDIYLHGMTWAHLVLLYCLFPQEIFQIPYLVWAFDRLQPAYTHAFYEFPTVRPVGGMCQSVSNEPPQNRLSKENLLKHTTITAARWNSVKHNERIDDWRSSNPRSSAHKVKKLSK